MENVLSVRAEELKPRQNRNYIPGHKKGGSISYFTLQQYAPEYIDLYRSDAFLKFMGRLVNTPLLLCPERDPHSCALYYYTEPGDHIGFHYDTSYYKGARYTVLLGLVDKTQQCQLACQLYKNDPERETHELRLFPSPGHTPGHVSIHISSEGKEAVITGDLLHHPVQMAEPDLPENFCMDAELACKTRRQFLKNYENKKAFIIGSHFCDPTGGWIISDDRNWRWEKEE